MLFRARAAAALLWATVLTTTQASNCAKLAPKIIVITLFDDERNSFLAQPNEINFLGQNLTVSGASPQFPTLHCTADGNACVFTTGEGMSNAGNSAMALWASPDLDLRQTYFLIAGIAGGNPKVVPTSSVTMARFSVQVALQYEIDAREMPANFSTGYFPQGAHSPGDAWGYVYNTEVFSVNSALRDLAFDMIDAAKLSDTPQAAAYRANYAKDAAYAAGAAKLPTKVKCDVATTDVWWSGALLGNAFEERMKAWTNGSSVYCTTAQEDGAVLAAMLRGHLAGKVDYGRIMVMRTISDVDRPYPNQTVIDNLVYEDPGSYEPSINNLYIAGKPIIDNLINHWDPVFSKGVPSTGYYGDLWGTLGGTPDFGPGRESGGSPVSIPEDVPTTGNAARKRSMRGRPATRKVL